MTDLTPEQIAYYEKRLGAPLDQTDLTARKARLGSDALVAAEVLQTRLASMLQRPLSFSIPGDYSEDRKENVAKLEKALAAVLNEAAAQGDSAEGSAVLRGVPTVNRWQR